ncbi:MAG: 23S rRNA (adenine(2503)-C(2))-methyltransferase RlmN [Candidatus Melainabacteria bacterium]|nr:23S rRNA (adenine(2503)-C(2))-methyltransferase RlmN [Candidatus Melainabacteria bacterium]
MFETIDKSSTKVSLSGLTESELIELVSNMNWPSFKGKQLHCWIYKKHISSFDEMSDLGIKEREFLKEKYELSTLKLKKKQTSTDKTIKYLWQLYDNNLVESVRMFLEDHKSYSACISSQVGCAVGCPFCATGTIGFKRNLKANEIIDQILGMQRDTKERISNIVFMGQGEPLLNYNEVIKSIHLIKDCIGIGARHITISTSGVISEIKKLAEENLQITLAVSLHAPDQKTRELLVPISRKYILKELIDSLHYYYSKTKRRITLEYIMLEDINDQIEKAKELAKLIKNLHCHINLIPYNHVGAFHGTPLLKRPSSGKIYKFKNVLENLSGKKTTIRHERGADIDAACGQLTSS